MTERAVLGKVVLITGTPGAGRGEYLDLFLKSLGSQERNQVQVISLRGRIYEEIQQTQPGTIPSDETILSMDESKLGSFRAAAVRKIVENDVVKRPITIVSTAASFLKEGGWIDGLKTSDVKSLSPYLAAIILDDVARVKTRLDRHPHWAKKKLEYDTIAAWRAKEEENSAKVLEALTEEGRIPLIAYLIPRDSPPSVLRDLIFEPSKKKAYFSFPITHMKRDDVDRAREFCQSMRKHYVIFDPLTIQDHTMINRVLKIHRRTRCRKVTWYRKGPVYHIQGAKTREQEIIERIRCLVKHVQASKRSLDHQIVDRDFHLVAQSDIVIVYYPVRELATGVICEMMYGKKHVQKQVYAYHPHEYSPFFEAMCSDDFTDSVKIFKSVSGFRSFLRKIA